MEGLQEPSAGPEEREGREGMGIQGIEGKGSKGWKGWNEWVGRDGSGWEEMEEVMEGKRWRNNVLKGEIREKDGLQGRRAQKGE